MYENLSNLSHCSLTNVDSNPNRPSSSQYGNCHRYKTRCPSPNFALPSAECVLRILPSPPPLRLTVGIAWSAQPESSGIPHGSASLLALGNRAGHIMFLRCGCPTLGPSHSHFSRLQNGQLELCHTLKVANSWITHLTWAPWEISINDQSLFSHSHIACGMPNGSILLIGVEQVWNRSSGDLLTTNFEVSAETPCEQDRSGITLLEWVSVRTGPVRDTSRGRMFCRN